MNVKNPPSASERRSARREGQMARGEADLVQVNVEVPKELRIKWKHAALDRNTTVTQLVIDAMTKFLGK